MEKNFEKLSFGFVNPNWTIRRGQVKSVSLGYSSRRTAMRKHWEYFQNFVWQERHNWQQLRRWSFWSVRLFHEIYNCWKNSVYLSLARYICFNRTSLFDHQPNLDESVKGNMNSVVRNILICFQKRQKWWKKLLVEVSFTNKPWTRMNNWTKKNWTCSIDNFYFENF